MNCTVLPLELVESKLSDIARRFTGTPFQRMIGIIEAAEGGTILLDEIGNIGANPMAFLL